MERPKASAFVWQTRLHSPQGAYDARWSVAGATGLGTFTHQLDRILPVGVPQSGLAPPYTQGRLGSGRLTMFVYANLSGLELPDRAQRRCEDHRICRWHGPPSRSSQPVALESSVPWSFPLSLSLDLRAALPSGTITATATDRAATGERSVQRQWPRLGPRLIKPTIQERRRGKQMRDNFEPICRSGLRCA